jgi:hypothetical protein
MRNLAPKTIISRKFIFEKIGFVFSLALPDLAYCRPCRHTFCLPVRLM